MTRGEYIYQRRKYYLDLIEECKIKFDDVGKVNFCKSVPKRMSHKIAAHYYTQKLKKVWYELGYFQKGFSDDSK